MGAPVIVVGAGFGGLSAALEMARRGERVTVLEREAEVEGKARSVMVAGRPNGARAVVDRADVATVATGAMGGRAAASVARLRETHRSLSALTWAMVGRSSGVDLAHHTVLSSGDHAAELRALFEHRQLPEDPTVDLCARDHGHARNTDENDRFLVIANAPATADGVPLSPKEIDRCERTIMARLSRAGLSLTLTPTATVVSTPTTLERLGPGTGGASHGQACRGAFAPFSRPS